MSNAITLSTQADRDIIDAEIRKFNHQHTGFDKNNYRQLISFCVRDENNEVIAGINGEIYFSSTLHIDVLWVKEGCRKHQYGSKLISAIEEEAKKHGTKLSHVETYEFQALPFYQKQDYRPCHSLDNDTGNGGHKLHFLSKEL